MNHLFLGILIAVSALATPLESAFETYIQALRGDGPVMPPPAIGPAASADELLPLLKKYGRDPNARVRFMIAGMASRYDTDEALELQVEMLSDADINVRSAVAVALLRSLGENVPKERSAAICRAVLGELGGERQAEIYLLLVACKPKNEEVVRQLQAWRARSHRKDVVSPWRHPALQVEETFAVDVVLAELGDGEALTRSVETCRERRAAYAAFVSHFSDHLRNPAWAEIIKRELDNEAIVEDFGSHAPGTFVRVCDFSLAALVRLKTIDVPFKADELRAFSDDELSIARSRVEAKQRDSEGRP